MSNIFRHFQPDDATTVYDWGIKCDGASDAVFLKIDGEHGTFKNKLSDKQYILISGQVDVNIDGKVIQYTAPNAFVISKNKMHQIKGVDAHMVCMCTPPFDPEYEEII